MAFILSALTWILFLVHSTINPFIWASSQANSTNTAKNLEAHDKTIIGVIVEAKRFRDFQKAKQLLTKSHEKNVSIEYRVVRNDPYDVLRMVCNNLTNVQGLVFVCEEPCARMTSFVSFIGMSGALVRRRREEHTPRFMVCRFFFISKNILSVSWPFLDTDGKLIEYSSLKTFLTAFFKKLVCEKRDYKFSHFCNELI